MKNGIIIAIDQSMIDPFDNLGAITCSNGPPCIPGKTPLFRIVDILIGSPFLVFRPHGFSKSLPIMIMPPLGPLSVLCVVEVTMWQYGIGSSNNFIAIRPAG